jgi:hypothetical protein
MTQEPKRAGGGCAADAAVAIARFAGRIVGSLFVVIGVLARWQSSATSSSKRSSGDDRATASGSTRISAPTGRRSLASTIRRTSPSCR